MDWTDSASRVHESSSDPAERFYSGALDRIRRFMLALGGAFVVAGLLIGGWPVALGAAVGSAVSYVNFHWLKQIVAGLAERAAQGEKAQSGGKVIRRFFFRFGLLALVAYVTLKGFPASFYGFVGGFFVVVAAILLEAGCELVMALARKY